MTANKVINNGTEVNTQDDYTNCKQIDSSLRCIEPISGAYIYNGKGCQLTRYVEDGETDCIESISVLGSGYE